MPTLRFRCRQEELARLEKVCADLAAAEGLDASQCSELNLVLEELLQNIIAYGHDDGVDHWIEVGIEIEDGTLEMTIEDDGKEFNPLEAPAPDLELALAERPIGGLGLHLVRTIMDEMSYERRDGRNHLWLSKRGYGASS